MSLVEAARMSSSRPWLRDVPFWRARCRDRLVGAGIPVGRLPGAPTAGNNGVLLVRRGDRWTLSACCKRPGWRYRPGHRGRPQARASHSVRVGRRRHHLAVLGTAGCSAPLAPQACARGRTARDGRRAGPPAASFKGSLPSRPAEGAWLRHPQWTRERKRAHFRTVSGAENRTLDSRPGYRPRL
jgi:hypothetical protein